jgi:hypothetical protein
MSNPENTVLLIYRIVGDRRIPYYFELDPTMTVVADRPDIDMLRSQTTTVAVPAPPPMHTNAAAAKALADATAARQVAVQTALAEAAASGAIVGTTAPELIAMNPALETPLDGVISKEKLPGGGNKIVYRPTPLDIKVGEWVTPLVTTNPIEGTDELRAEFFAAETALRAKHEADGTVCKPCELGALIRKYRAKLEEQGLLK